MELTRPTIYNKLLHACEIPFELKQPYKCCIAAKADWSGPLVAILRANFVPLRVFVLYSVTDPALEWSWSGESAVDSPATAASHSLGESESSFELVEARQLVLEDIVLGEEEERQARKLRNQLLLCLTRPQPKLRRTNVIAAHGCG